MERSQSLDARTPSYSVADLVLAVQSCSRLPEESHPNFGLRGRDWMSTYAVSSAWNTSKRMSGCGKTAAEDVAQ
ncbi:MAG: hypothetical protein OJF51_000880 [Nitrospira sp.]|nr:MAG: hypothetical protein OJF51_000880 [Nitrospira sp.]